MIDGTSAFIRDLNIILDVYSCGLCMILLFSVYFSHGRKTKLGQYFMLMCLFNAGMLLGDIPNWSFEGMANPWNPVLLKAGTVLYFVSSGPLLLCFTGYVIQCLPSRVHVWPGYWRIAVFLCGIQVACSLLSLSNGMYYSIIEGNFYERGTWFWLSQGIPFLMFFMDGIFIASYSGLLGKKTCIFLSTYIFLPAVAEIIQIFHYGFSPLSTAASISILLIFIHIQLEKEHLMELQKKELERAQADVLLSQIQPHFLYNSLTAIRYLCESDPHEAKQAISDFSLFLRANMNSLKSKTPIPLEQELKHVELYLNLEKRRFGERISVQFEILESEFFIPPLTLQPLVENAVHHGILKKQEGGTIIIRSEEKAGTYVIVVSDDGSGFSESTIRRGGIEKEGSHIGIENVRGRLAAMANGVLEIQSREGVGTHIMITIPKGKKTQEDNHEISFGRR